ncbi:MAG: hypothetical protein ABIT38_20535 [Gemmatimonadaceae bacterium]
MLRFIGEGAERRRIEDEGGRRVGWIRGRTIGFSGFQAEDDAVRCALPAAMALASILARAYPGWPHHDPGQRELRFVREGSFDWIVVGPIPLGRLLRPLADSAKADFAVEFILPSYARVGVIESAASELYSALFSRRKDGRRSAGAEIDRAAGLHFTDEPIHVA